MFLWFLRIADPFGKNKIFAAKRDRFLSYGYKIAGRGAI
jgi:hypothetical protein